MCPLLGRGEWHGKKRELVRHLLPRWKKKEKKGWKKAIAKIRGKARQFDGTNMARGVIYR